MYICFLKTYLGIRKVLDGMHARGCHLQSQISATQKRDDHGYDTACDGRGTAHHHVDLRCRVLALHRYTAHLFAWGRH